MCIGVLVTIYLPPKFHKPFKKNESKEGVGFGAGFVEIKGPEPTFFQPRGDMGISLLISVFINLCLLLYLVVYDTPKNIINKEMRLRNWSVIYGLIYIIILGFLGFVLA